MHHYVKVVGVGVAEEEDVALFGHRGQSACVSGLWMLTPIGLIGTQPELRSSSYSNQPSVIWVRVAHTAFSPA